MHVHIGDAKQYFGARVKRRSDQIFHDFLLPVNGDGLAIGQRREIDPMSAAAETQLNAVVAESFALQPLLRSRSQ